MPSFKGGLKAIANSLTIAPQQQPAQQHPLGYGNGQGRPPTSSQDGAPGRQGNGQAANGGARNASHNVRDENEEGEENPFEGESSQVNGQPRTPHRANTGEQRTNLIPGASEHSEVDLHVAQLYNNAQRSLIDEQDGIDGSRATGSTNRQPHAGNQPGVIQAWNNGNVQQADFYHVVHFVKWLIEQHPDKFRKPLPTSDDPNLLQYVTSHVDYYFRELNKLAVAYEKDTKSLDKQLTEAKKKQKPIMDTHIQRSEYEKLQKQRDRVVLENKTLTEQNKQHVKHANEQTRAVNTLDSELKTLRFRNTQLEGTNKRLGGEAAGNSATISTLKSEVQRLVEQCKTLTTDVSTRDGQIGGLNGRIVDLESERDYARGVLAGEKEKLRLEHNEEKGQLQTRHDREREELMNKHDAAMTTLRQDHSGKYGALEQQLRSAQGEAERQRSNMSDKHREEVKKLKTEHSTAITEATSRLEKKITTMQTKHDESQDALGKKHKDELASYEEDAKMYQRALTTSADSVQSLTDAGLRDKLAQLKNAVEALSRAPFREKPAPDMTVLGEISGQAEIVSTMPSKHRKFLLESAIWSLLMRELFTLPVGLSSIGPGGADLVQLWVMLFATTGTPSRVVYFEIGLMARRLYSNI